jgi:alkane 1-monooxygenase
MNANPESRAARHVAWCLLPQLLFVLWSMGLWAGQGWTALPVLFLLVAVPTLDWLTRWQDDARFMPTDFGAFPRAVLRWNVRIYAVLSVASVSFVTLSVARFSKLEIGFLLASASLMSAVGFAAAHELLHAPSRIDQALQAVSTRFLFYPHYKLIHIYSHHVHVGTPLDQNTAWPGEGIYRYLWRTVPGSMQRCWVLERERMTRSGERSRVEWLRNRMVVYGVGQVLWVTVVYLLAGFSGLAFYVAHFLGAHVLLESVNYIQHYGLLRAPWANSNQFERTAPRHSWDSYHWFSSYVTFRTGHHSNHHVHAGSYHLLAPEAAAPRLPVGYFWAIPLVLVPPLWKAVIRTRVPALSHARRPEGGANIP